MWPSKQQRYSTFRIGVPVIMTHRVHRLADAVMCMLHNALVNAENAVIVLSWVVCWWVWLQAYSVLDTSWYIVMITIIACVRKKTVLIAATALMFQPTVPRCRRITFGRRAFSVAGPMVWNSLPTEFRDLSVRFGDFGRTLKTILFARYYSASCAIEMYAWYYAVHEVRPYTYR